MFLLGVSGAAFGTPVMPSSANGSSPPKEDGGRRAGQNGNTLIRGQHHQERVSRRAGPDVVFPAQVPQKHTRAHGDG
jgi:hypothetical protein